MGKETSLYSEHACIEQKKNSYSQRPLQANASSIPFRPPAEKEGGRRRKKAVAQETGREFEGNSKRLLDTGLRTRRVR